MLRYLKYSNFKNSKTQLWPVNLWKLQFDWEFQWQFLLNFAHNEYYPQLAGEYSSPLKTKFESSIDRISTLTGLNVL
mgnify:FL=1